MAILANCALLSMTTGDGTTVPFVNANYQVTAFRDDLIQITGTVQMPGQDPVAILGLGTYNGPGAPVSGTNYWISQVDTTNGVVTSKNSTVAMPTADAGNLALCATTQATTDTDLSLALGHIQLLTQW